MVEPLPYPAGPPVDRSHLAPAGAGSMPTVWSRVGARLIDELLIGLPLGLAIGLWLVVRHPDRSFELDAVPRPALIALTVVPLVYEFAALRWFGATVGKWAVGVRVVSFGDGGTPRPYQLGLRVVVVAIGSLLGLAALPDAVDQLLSLVTPVMLVSTIVDPLGRGLHDKAAGTIVLRSR